jgi:hypothetical protein
MEKLMEKRNLGIPVTILSFFAFIIGYAMTLDYSILLVAVLYAFVVFSFQFDDKVKSAVKQSYIISFVANLIYLGLNGFYQFVEMVTPNDLDYNLLQSAMNNVYKYAKLIVNVAVIVIYVILLIFVLIRKDVKIGFVSSVLGEGTPKPAPVYQQPMPQQMYQQPIQPQPIPQPYPMYNQPVQQPYQQPVYQQPQQTQQPQKPLQPMEQAAQGIKCIKCGTVNQSGALFCASCGAKLN